ncbi:MAG TPA: hypothetical protein VFK37_03175 [Bacillales bacterium]|nr:hypothetical protein [Bacillales bacterium]
MVKAKPFFGLPHGFFSGYNSPCQCRNLLKIDSKTRLEPKKALIRWDPLDCFCAFARQKLPYWYGLACGDAVRRWSAAAAGETNS